MIDETPIHQQILKVSSFEAMVNADFQHEVNAICWQRSLKGDFEEIVQKFQFEENLKSVEMEELLALDLSEAGQIAREIILNDFKLLSAYGALPNLNIIKYYEKDQAYPFFPTDVYSYHVDHSPIPTSTFLCTYFGEASELLPNEEAEQKILVPEIRQELKKLHQDSEESFEEFLTEHFFDLHYQALPNAKPVNLGLGHLWRLAVDCPESNVLPCIHRAPKEKEGESRLLMIC